MVKFEQNPLGYGNGGTDMVAMDTPARQDVDVLKAEGIHVQKTDPDVTQGESVGVGVKKTELYVNALKINGVDGWEVKGSDGKSSVV